MLNVVGHSLVSVERDVLKNKFGFRRHIKMEQAADKMIS